ncbi:MAG TPA: TM0106 family RecB-like putative nuclease, partial [Candidatus Sulfotelmatobacter sp.]|nr:TM0106 family RecB-like putative nuclease [Candidatus Sulfotelmatobacter sp.]
MQRIDGQPAFSATDLVGFLACEHLTDLERAALAGLVERPQRVDPELDRVAKRGEEHERRFLAERRAEGLSITEIRVDPDADRGAGLRAAADATVAAMRAGVEVIYQAAFFDGRWLGFADFLRRVEVPSELGGWSYEVWDTKLARHTKGSAVLQLALYSAQLARLQGHEPELMHVALGGSAREVDHLRVADYAAYVRAILAQFEAATGGPAPATYPPASRPDPVEHCDICRWSQVCEAQRRAADDLSLVAGITAHQRTALRARDVPTRTALGALPLPMWPPLEGTTPTSLARVHEQARLQVAGDAVRPGVLSERIAPSRRRDGTLEPDRGLLSLPAPSPGDLFFDIEGDPFALEDGVDYLFGVLEPGQVGADCEAAFHAWWSIEA